MNTLGHALLGRSLITKRERRTIVRTLRGEMPYLSDFFDKLEAVAASADERIEAAELRADNAERRERDTAIEIRRMRARIAELESRP